MRWFDDLNNRRIRLTAERFEHIESDHPEMSGQLDKITETLSVPDIILGSKIDAEVELWYRHYANTPVGEKHMCVVVKVKSDDAFIITAYFTDTIKKGEILWEKK
jgi:hypothetical protein